MQINAENNSTRLSSNPTKRDNGLILHLCYAHIIAMLQYNFQLIYSIFVVGHLSHACFNQVRFFHRQLTSKQAAFFYTHRIMLIHVFAFVQASMLMIELLN